MADVNFITLATVDTLILNSALYNASSQKNTLVILDQVDKIVYKRMSSENFKSLMADINFVIPLIKLSLM